MCAASFYYPSEEAEGHFEEYLIETYEKLANYNFEVNDKRYKTIGNANLFIIMSVITTLLTLGCYVPSMFKKDAGIQEVKLIGDTDTNNIKIEEKSKAKVQEEENVE
ncbi:hypothetical protein [Metabacillus hrfriensis]|uniref:Uncharacterized protein n=1 Tax=Metabacillus hrfriensis TaxID=3048891 RepID=A0ACD4RIS4_9BACI|nr:hypothetical protein [Metabacillus sp. CT-WN-B3]WHZ60085.1 hypothetical protein QLQ22_12450 [Metabacillus sp. CT-WN-B3]